MGPAGVLEREQSGLSPVIPSNSVLVEVCLDGVCVEMSCEVFGRSLTLWVMVLEEHQGRSLLVSLAEQFLSGKTSL
jgi:hypothetical protein